jgi:hypothetical protein
MPYPRHFFRSPLLSSGKLQLLLLLILIFLYDLLDLVHALNLLNAVAKSLPALAR